MTKLANPTTKREREAKGKESSASGFALFLVIPAGKRGHPRGLCEGCGRPIWSEGYRVPGIGGLFCTVACIESSLFGGPGHCRWCAAEMNNVYPKDGTVECRLCSTDCRANYRAFVLGDRSARLGSGKRFLLWLQKKQPAIYRQLVGASGPTAKYCHNPRCPNGTDGKPATLDHLRAGSRFCSAACKMQGQRSPLTGKNRGEKPPFLLRFRVTLPTG